MFSLGMSCTVCNEQVGTGGQGAHAPPPTRPPIILSSVKLLPNKFLPSPSSLPIQNPFLHLCLSREVRTSLVRGLKIAQILSSVLTRSHWQLVYLLHLINCCLIFQPSSTPSPPPPPPYSLSSFLVPESFNCIIIACHSSIFYCVSLTYK